MEKSDKKTDYTEYAIAWMQAHEEPLPPDKQVALESIPSYLNKKLGERDMTTAQLFEAAGTERSTGYKIMNGQLLPSRDSLLRVAFVLKLERQRDPVSAQGRPQSQAYSAGFKGRGGSALHHQAHVADGRKHHPRRSGRRAAVTDIFLSARRFFSGRRRRKGSS